MKVALFFSCLGVVLSFPTNPWRSLSFPLSSEQIINSISDVEPDGNVYTYVQILANDGLSLKLYIYNSSVSPPSQLVLKIINFSSPATNPTITPLNTSILLSYLMNGNEELLQLTKSTLVNEYTTTTLGKERGLYMKEYDYLISIREI